jgi:hypothetical protein
MVAIPARLASAESMMLLKSKVAKPARPSENTMLATRTSIKLNPELLGLDDQAANGLCCRHVLCAITYFSKLTGVIEIVIYSR